MEKAVFTTRFLTDAEVTTLTREVKSFPDLVYVPRRVWQKHKVHVLSVNGRFAGVIIAYVFEGWVKLGPLVILGKFHGKGLGKALVKHAVDKHRSKNILITSTNPKVGKIAALYGFKKMAGFLSLPLTAKIFLLRQLLDYLRMETVAEVVRKSFAGRRGKRTYFVKFSP
jgi:GNAT superfamily N-acetyltransferase